MDNPKKPKKLLLKTLGLAAAAVVAAPFAWGLYMYGRASHFAFKYPKTTLAGLVLAGGLAYAATNDTVQQYMSDSVTNMQQQYVAYNVRELEQQVQELQKHNGELEHILETNGQILDASNKKLYMGMGAGAGITLLSLAAYGFSQPRKNRVRVMR